MKRFRLALVALISVVSVSSALAQDASYLPPRARTYAAAAGASLAPQAGSHVATVAQFLAARGVAVPTGALVEVATNQALNGLTVVRYEERAAGLAVYGVYAKAAFNPQGELVHLIENLVPALTTVPAARITPSEALAVALQRQYGTSVVPPAQARAQGNTVVFEQTPFFHDAPSATRVAVVVNGTLQAAMLVETWSQQQNLLHHTLVGGRGDVLGVELRTNTDKYNVFAVSPKVSTQGVITGPTPVSIPGTTPSPAGWLGSGTQNTVNITGNNAHSYLDSDANNRPDKGGTTVTNGEFLAAWGGTTSSPTTATNKAVAVQNLFYLNNTVHDLLYGHGFVEAAGNFQQDNFGRGGVGNDPVQAEAQDGSGTDNANFSTPADGRSPRMQMYLWSNPAPDHEVVVSGTSYGAKKADFTPSLTTTGISATMVLANDGVGTATDACEPMSGLTGKIVLVDRGTCSFKTKVVYAQNAGAVAVVVANNTGGDAIFVMGDDPAILNRIKIPAVMIGQNNGTTLKGILGAGMASTVRKLAVVPPMIDASVDSDVVFHEYGHGLTWRMIGNMNGPLAGAIGEGASDGVALLINADDAIGEYSAGNTTGIRSAPYGSMNKTYSSVTGAEVHDDGELFGEIVYRLKRDAGTYQVSTEQLFNLYVDGMNHTQARPAWEDMRDGMLVSAGTNAGAKCLIWTTFAGAGVGEGAKGVENADGTVTITESFVIPAGACQ